MGRQPRGMEITRHFVLPSNGSDTEFPTNKPNDYTTLLKTPLVGGVEEYELALTELQFVRALPTIQDDIITFQAPRRQGAGRAPEPISIPTPSSIIRTGILI